MLLGPSGSGKSTLLNILGGLDVPSSGTVFYRGEQLTEFDDAALTRYRREHVGFVFQFYNLIPSLTARENVGAGHRHRPQSDEARPRRWHWWNWPTGRITFRRSFPAASSSAWPSPGPSPRTRPCCCATSRPVRSMCRPASWCSKRSRGSTRSWDTTTAVITHNAVIAEMADRVISISDGKIVHVERRQHKKYANELTW